MATLMGMRAGASDMTDASKAMRQELEMFLGFAVARLRAYGVPADEILSEIKGAMRGYEIGRTEREALDKLTEKESDEA
jgi:hypothetical protein